MPCPLLTYPTAVQSQLGEVSAHCQSSGYRGKGESGTYLHHVDTVTQTPTVNARNECPYCIISPPPH